MKWQEPRWDGFEIETELPEWPAEADRRVCDETFGEWGRRRRELMGGRGHWCEFLFSSDLGPVGSGVLFFLFFFPPPMHFHLYFSLMVLLVCS